MLVTLALLVVARITLPSLQPVDDSRRPSLERFLGRYRIDTSYKALLEYRGQLLSAWFAELEWKNGSLAHPLDALDVVEKALIGLEGDLEISQGQDGVFIFHLRFTAGDTTVDTSGVLEVVFLPGICLMASEESDPETPVRWVVAVGPSWVVDGIRIPLSRQLPVRAFFRRVG
jgi:hypothetical protein